MEEVRTVYTHVAFIDDSTTAEVGHLCLSILEIAIEKPWPNGTRHFYRREMSEVRHAKRGLTLVVAAIIGKRHQCAIGVY
jgi:hypothetical protein